MSIVRPILRRRCSMSWNPGDVPATWGDPGAPGIQAPGELSRGPLASGRGQRGTTVDAPREPPTPLPPPVPAWDVQLINWLDVS